MGVWRFATFSRNARTRACVGIRLSSPQSSASRRAWSPPRTDENGRQSKCGPASLPTLRGTEGSNLAPSASESAANPASSIRGTLVSHHSRDAGDADPVGIGERLQPRGYVDAISEDARFQRHYEFGEMRRGEFDRLPVQDVGGAGDSRSRPTGSRNTHASAVFSSIGPHCCSNSAL